MQAIPDISSQAINQFFNLTPAWWAMVQPYAYRLFWILALIDFGWTAITMVLEHQSMEQWGASLIRAFVVRGVFYALLLNGPEWTKAIMMSLQKIGQDAAHVSQLSPGDVVFRGVKIAASLLSASTAAGFMNAIAAAPLAIFCGILIVLSFILISANLVMALLSSYTMIGAAIFLGFGGSRWTTPYVERYLALAVAIGVKLMLHYFLVGTAMQLSAGWSQSAQNLIKSPTPAFDTLAMMGSSILLCVLCWQIPKLFSEWLGGSPALSGGDLFGFGAMVAMSYVGGRMALSNMFSTSTSGGATAASGSAGSAGGTSGSHGAGAGSIGAGLPQSVPAPGKGSGGGNGGRGNGSGGSTMKGVVIGAARSLSADHAPPPSPPRMPIDHHE